MATADPPTGHQGQTNTRVSDTRRLRATGIGSSRLLAGALVAAAIIVAAAFSLLPAPAGAQTAVDICDRTAEVQAAILRAAKQLNNDQTITCSTITDTQLAALTYVSNIATTPTAGTIEIVGYSSATLLSSDFAGLTGAMTAIYIHDSPDLQTVPANAFSELTKSGYTEINLTRTGVRSVASGAFNGFSSVTTLHLIGNKITSLQAGIFGGLSAVTEIDLTGNELSSVDPTTFQGLSTLTTLEMANNRISSLNGATFSSLTSLTRLALEGNRLRGLDENLFSGLTALAQLHLQQNRLSSLPSDIFDGLTVVNTLYLAGNELTSIPEDLFDGMTSLFDLDLKDNRLSSLDPNTFKPLAGKLLRLNLSINKLASLEAGLFDSQNRMFWLYLQSNELEALPAGIFGGLSSLFTLDLSCNSLTTAGMPLARFDPLVAKLTTLDLSRNAFTSDDPLDLTALQAKLTKLSTFTHQSDEPCLRARTPAPTATPAPAQEYKLIHRSKLTRIQNSEPQSGFGLWFPTDGRDCEAEPDTMPDLTHCGYLHFPPDVRDNLAAPVDHLAFAVYTALDPNPALPLLARLRHPSSSRTFDLAVWAVFPHPQRTTNSVSRVDGPFATAFMLCLPNPGGGERVVMRYDKSASTWTQLDLAEPQQPGQVCGMATDLSIITLATSTAE